MSTANTIINVRIDRKTKSQATKIMHKLGLDVSSAVKMFLYKIIETDGIPFHVGKMNNPHYIAETKREVEYAIAHGKRYSTAKLFKEWDKIK